MSFHVPNRLALGLFLVVGLLAGFSTSARAEGDLYVSDGTLGPEAINSYPGYNFGSVPVLTTVTQTFTLTNVSASTTITAIKISVIQARGSTLYSLSSPCSSKTGCSLAPGATMQFSVSYAPSSAVSSSGWVNFSWSEGGKAYPGKSGPSIEFAISGSGM